MPKSASGTTSTQCQGTAPGMPCCHSYPDTGDQAVRMGRWFVSMARANCTSIALMHALNRYNIYIYTHLSPQCICFSLSIYFFIHDLDFHISCCMLAMIPASGRALQQQQRPRRHHQAYRSTTFRFSVAWLR